VSGTCWRGAAEIRGPSADNRQLIDALQGNHLWADRYDRDLKDIFALQDEITIKILNGVRVKLTLGGEVSRAEKYPKNITEESKSRLLFEVNPSVWSLHTLEYPRYQLGTADGRGGYCPVSRESNGLYRPRWIYHHDYWLGNPKSRAETLEKGIELVQKALAIDDSISEAHALLCAFYMAKREYDKAIARENGLWPSTPAGRMNS